MKFIWLTVGLSAVSLGLNLIAMPTAEYTRTIQHPAAHMMTAQDLRPQEDYEAICRKGPSDLEHKEYSCDCPITCAESPNGEKYQIESPGCSTHCHALTRRDPDTGAITRAGGCLCHPDERENPCEGSDIDPK